MYAAADVCGADNRVAADADGGREPYVPQLVHELTGEGAGLGGVARMQSGLRGDVGGDDPGVGAVRR